MRFIEAPDLLFCILFIEGFQKQAVTYLYYCLLYLPQYTNVYNVYIYITVFIIVLTNVSSGQIPGKLLYWYYTLYSPEGREVQ